MHLRRTLKSVFRFDSSLLSVDWQSTNLLERIKYVLVEEKYVCVLCSTTHFDEAFAFIENLEKRIFVDVSVVRHSK